MGPVTISLLPWSHDRLLLSIIVGADIGLTDLQEVTMILNEILMGILLGHYFLSGVISSIITRGMVLSAPHAYFYISYRQGLIW